MGYTTNFVGKFDLSKLPSAESIVAIRALEDFKEAPKGSPGGYCQWQLSRDCMSLKWDGGEKFYDYEEWLQWIVDLLKKDGVEVSGKVKYSGEDVDDRGILQVRNGKVEKAAQPIVEDDIESLKRFKEFVLNSDWRDEILEAFENSKR